MQINNFSKKITEEEVIRFLMENVNKDLDSVNFHFTNTGTKHNKCIIVFSGVSPDEIKTAKEKINFNEHRQKFFDRPL